MAFPRVLHHPGKDSRSPGQTLEGAKFQETGPGQQSIGEDEAT